MNKIVGIAVIGFIFLNGCQKAELPFEDASPVFKIFTASDSIAAGENDVFLCTGSTSSGTTRVQYAYFTPGECAAPNFPGSLRIEYINQDTSGSGIEIGSKPYFLDNSYSIFQISLSAKPDNLGADRYAWQLPGAIANGPVVLWETDAADPFFATLSVNSPSGVFYKIRERIIPDPLKNPCPAIGIQLVTSDSQEVILAVNTDFYQIQWNDGDTSNFKGWQPGMDSIALNAISDSSGCQINYSFFNLQALNSDEVAPVIEYNTEVFTSPINQEGIIVQLVDATGTIWRSDLKTQPLDSYWKVVASEPYEKNSQGNLTYKLEVNFNCLLFNNFGEIRDFTGTGVIALEQ